MLALTHHLIVQYAFQNIRGKLSNKWYDQYELLGDDIVLFEEDIATEYLRLMTSFGVGINLSKSVVAKTDSLEFAKVLLFKGVNVSAISWRMFISQNNNMGRVNILFQLLPKLDIKHPIRYIKQIVSKSLLDLGNYKFNLIALMTMLSNSGKISLHGLLSSLVTIVGENVNLLKTSIKSLNETFVESLIVAMVKGTPLPKRNNSLFDELYAREVPFYHILLYNRLTSIKERLGNENMVHYKLIANILDSLAPGWITPSQF